MPEKTYFPNQVTVVIPAYNEERFLREALDSVVNQVECALIGDNVSTDGTEAICREYAAKYPHVKYFRHTENLGSLGNLIYLLDRVETEYFVHIGAHDIVPPNYVAALKAELACRPNYFGAYANSHTLELGGVVSQKLEYDKIKKKNAPASFTEQLEDDSPFRRVQSFLLPINYTHIIFGLFRSERMIPIWRNAESIGGCDNVALWEMALKGKVRHCASTNFFLRNVHPNDTGAEYMKRITGKDEAEATQNDWAKNLIPMAQKIKELYLETPCEPQNMTEKRRVYREIAVFYCHTLGIRTGIFHVDLWDRLCRIVRTTRQSLFQVRFSKNKKYVRLFGLTLYERDKTMELRDRAVVIEDYVYSPKYRNSLETSTTNHIFNKLDVNDLVTKIETMAKYKDKFAKIKDEFDPNAPAEPNWNNIWIPPLDAISIYTILAEKNPRYYLECGSGNTTKFAYRSIRDNNLRTKIISIDPCPRAEIDQICHKVLRMPFENVDLAYFSEFTEEDVFVIDNSHRSFPNSDVTVFFTEVLPNLPSGMLFAIHDIFLPCDYPEVWNELRRFYNEQYLLCAYLLGGAMGDEIYFPCAFVGRNETTKKSLQHCFNAETFSTKPVDSGGFFWMKKK